MHVELALREEHSEEVHSLLDMISDETDRASHLANQLLTLARAEPGSSIPTSRTPLNLRDVANRAVQDWVPQAVARNMDLGFELEDAWRWVSRCCCANSSPTCWIMRCAIPARKAASRCERAPSRAR